MFPIKRLRRLRQHPTLRSMLHDVSLSVSDLIYPLFIHHNDDHHQTIDSMPGVFQIGLNQLDKEIKSIVSLGIPAVLLFGLPDHKDSVGSHSYSDSGVVQKAIKHIKAIAPELYVISDVCFCEYTDHGHCGVLHECAGRTDVDNDATLELLQWQAVSHAKAGVDMVAPSGMIDGMISAMRSALDDHGFSHLPIMSYSMKYASAFYGPFRDVADCAPQFGNRASYQMDCRRRHEFLSEIESDMHEGADITMVKPAMPYLDVIASVKQRYPEIPMAAYHVSGEYAMLKAAAEKGWLDEQRVVLESMYALKRAGVDLIITYYAKEIAGWLASA